MQILSALVLFVALGVSQGFPAYVPCGSYPELSYSAPQNYPAPQSYPAPSYSAPAPAKPSYGGYREMTTYDVGVPQTYRGYAFPKDIHLSVAPGAPRSYSYPSPAPSVPCPQNLLLGCSPSVAAVPCKSVSYPAPPPSYHAPAPQYIAPAAQYSAPAAPPAYSKPSSSYRAMEVSEADGN